MLQVKTNLELFINTSLGEVLLHVSLQEIQTWDSVDNLFGGLNLVLLIYQLLFDHLLILCSRNYSMYIENTAE